MAVFMVRGINNDLWKRFRARADASGHPYRWVLLELIEGYAAGTIETKTERPKFMKKEPADTKAKTLNHEF